MKNIIPILCLAFLMSCNSNNNTKTNSIPEGSVSKEAIKKIIEQEVEQEDEKEVEKEVEQEVEKKVEKKEQSEPAKPRPEKINNVFEGVYSYMADANRFVSCDQKRSMPVAMKGEYINLERQYLRTVDGGVEVYVKLQGYIKKIPSKGGDTAIDALFIEKILELSKDKKCQ
jgi:hypothetical protein